uniref:Fibronectin type-III domain-containing protein n=1 Tax=Plectus sambesii TaxID=2011161 RepID=A0A914XIN2_9BILA
MFTSSALLCALLLLHAGATFAQLGDEPRQQKVPSAPREVEVIQVNASTVKVSWQRPAHSNGVLIGYYVYKEQLINGEPVSDQLQRAMVIHDPD